MTTTGTYDVSHKALLNDVKTAGLFTLNHTAKRAGADFTYKLVKADNNLYHIVRSTTQSSVVTGTITEIAAWLDGATFNLQKIANLYPSDPTK